MRRKLVFFFTFLSLFLFNMMGIVESSVELVLPLCFFLLQLDGYRKAQLCQASLVSSPVKKEIYFLKLVRINEWKCSDLFILSQLISMFHVCWQWRHSWDSCQLKVLGVFLLSTKVYMFYCHLKKKLIDFILFRLCHTTVTFN